MTPVSLIPDVTLTPSDELCLRLLADSGLFADPVISGLQDWWCRTRAGGEGLAPFLVRAGIFLSFTTEELDLIDKKYITFSTIHHFFAPGGIHRLRDKVGCGELTASPASLPQHAAPAADDTHLAHRESPDTVHSSQKKRPSDLDEKKQPATEPLKDFALAQRPKPAQASTAHSGDVAPGTTLGAYKIIGPIGRGPRGFVFEARDPEQDATVAVKILAPEMAARGAAWVQRFIQEARVASRVEHPQILPILSIGQDRGVVYFAMPLMRGGSALAEMRSKGPFAPIDATQMARQVARALVAAHDLGLSHGNLKPSNIFLCETGDVKIADFMIPHLPLNQAEHVALRAQDVAADLRLLGATYQRLLTCRPPLNAPQFDLWNSSNGARGRSEVPDVCANIIAAVLSRKRAQFFPTAATMADALAEAEEALRTLDTNRAAPKPGTGSAITDDPRKEA